MMWGFFSHTIVFQRLQGSAKFVLGIYWVHKKHLLNEWRPENSALHYRIVSLNWQPLGRVLELEKEEE